MSKGLEALERIKNNLKDEDNYINLFDTLDLSIIEKELKAFEIIRNKYVNVGYFVNCINAKEYNKWYERKYHLTQEEYNLLKEVFEND